MGTDRIGGEVTLDGDPVEDAVVVVFRVVDDNGELDADVQFVGTTDDLGEYETDQLPERDEWHGVVEFEGEGGDQYAALSKPFVDAGPYLRAAHGDGSGFGDAAVVRVRTREPTGTGTGSGSARAVGVVDAAASGVGTGVGAASVGVGISRAQALSRRLNDIRPTVIEAEAPADPSIAQSYTRRAGGMAGRRGADSE